MSDNLTASTTETTAVLTATNRLTTSAKRSLSESSADELHREYKEKMHADAQAKRRIWHNELVIQQGDCAAQLEHRRSSLCHGTDAGGRVSFSDLTDIGLRMFLVILFFKLEVMRSFKRVIQLQEIWLYMYPRTPDIVTPDVLFLSAILGPFFTTLIFLLLTRDRRDFRAASWVWTLALGLNGVITSTLKITVGRPRPDFFYRCFPDGVLILNNITASISGPMLHGTLNILNCTGNQHDINEGFKSFPSGHSSFAFCALSFITFYMGSKLHAFTPLGRGQSWRLCIASMPLLLAALVSVSRTCDYHHHWQDVVVGSLIGYFVTYGVYRQYYPSVFSRNAHRAYSRGHHYARKTHIYTRVPDDSDLADDDQHLLQSDEEEDFNKESSTSKPLAKDKRTSIISADNGKQNKWI